MRTATGKPRPAIVRIWRGRTTAARAVVARAWLSYHGDMLSELDVLRDVCARLERSGIDYMLTGSMAMNYYAQPRMTRDIDIVVALDERDAGRISAAFGADYYVPDDAVQNALHERGMFNLLHIESVVKVDMIVRKEAPYRQVEFARRMRVNLPGFPAWLTSREDLILSKLVWALDSGSELQLRDVRNLLAEPADTNYLRQWAPGLGVSKLLEDCLSERYQS